MQTKTKSKISLKAGKEIQHNLLEFSVGGFRDFAIGPTKKKEKKRSNQQKPSNKSQVLLV